MNAQRRWFGYEWLARLVEREESRTGVRPPKRRRRRHADWAAEFGIMLVLVALLPRQGPGK